MWEVVTLNETQIPEFHKTPITCYIIQQYSVDEIFNIYYFELPVSNA